MLYTVRTDARMRTARSSAFLYPLLLPSSSTWHKKKKLLCADLLYTTTTHTTHTHTYYIIKKTPFLNEATGNFSPFFLELFNNHCVQKNALSEVAVSRLLVAGSFYFAFSQRSLINFSWS